MLEQVFSSCIGTSTGPEIQLFKRFRQLWSELLEIRIIFLGGVPAREVRIMNLRAMHPARFMSRLLYNMKIFIFRNSGFHLTNRELTGLKDLCVFAVKLYIKSWFSSRLGISATRNDLMLAQELLASGDQLSPAALQKLKQHFWYLSDKVNGFSFFDDSISVDDKRKMVEELAEKGEDPAKQIIV